MPTHRSSARQVVLAALAFAVACCVARGEGLPPAPEKYFNDYAGVTKQGTQHDLNERLAKFDKDTSNQVVVAIYPKMDSELSLDEYTLRVAKAWGVGERAKNNGVILFVFVRDHKMRIQVGYGLTNVLTDAVSKQILDEDLKPQFQKGDFDSGLTGAVDSVLRITGRLPAQEPSATPEQAVASRLNLETSLTSGPSASTLELLLSDYVAHNASFSPSQRTNSVQLYENGFFTNELKKAAITNEYTRSVDGETIFVYDFDVEVQLKGSPVLAQIGVPAEAMEVINTVVRKTSFSAGVIKRGKKWYMRPAPR